MCEQPQFASNPEFVHLAGQGVGGIENYEGLIVKLARSHWRKLLGAGLNIDQEDVLQEVRAAWAVARKGFKPELGYRFSTYFVRVVGTHVRLLMENERRNTQKLGAVSLDASIGGGGDTFYSLTPSTDLTPDQAYDREERMHSILRRLTPAARLVLNWLFEPPQHLEREIKAFRHKQTVTQSRRLAAEDPSLSIVVEYVARLKGLSRSGYYSLLREVKSIYQ